MANPDEAVEFIVGQTSRELAEKWLTCHLAILENNSPCVSDIGTPGTADVEENPIAEPKEASTFVVFEEGDVNPFFDQTLLNRTLWNYYRNGDINVRRRLKME